jgi:hypothetical protein
MSLGCCDDGNKDPFLVLSQKIVQEKAKRGVDTLLQNLKVHLLGEFLGEEGLLVCTYLARTTLCASVHKTHGLTAR